MVLLLVLFIGTATGYDFKCPIQAEWRLRANNSCSLAETYVCLFHLLKKKYQEDCLESSESKIGSKLVFQPFFNLAPCNTGHFQPIVFTTNGNSDCMLLKSKCEEKGQVVYSNGSSNNDTTCRCDYTHGYAFVSNPEKNSCYCKPSEEDCTCFRVKCAKLSSDYRCITDSEIMTNTKCQEIHPHISFKLYNQTDHTIQDNMKRTSNAHIVFYTIFVLLIVYVSIAVLTVIVLEYKERKFEQLKSKDDDRLKCIQELFLKGECGKHHFARVVFIGKGGVGKTSLMRRLLWQKKTKATSPESTDGIEIEKCNINVTNGKWSPCDEIGDDLTRLIHQVYREKNKNEQRPVRDNLCEEKHIGNTTDDYKNVSNIDKSDDTYADINNKRNERPHNSALEISRANINPSMFKKEDRAEMEETDLNKKQQQNIPFQPSNDNNEYECDSDTVNDEDINQMTSSIMKSYLHRYIDDEDDALAFCWLWDFAGQKDFYATHQVFMSKCAVYLLVTDSLEFSTSGKPWIDLNDSAQYVSFWFDAIHCYWSTTEKGRLNPPIIVVCTNEDRCKEPSEQQKRQEIFKDNLGKVLNRQKKKEHLRNIYFVSNTEDEDDVFEKIRKEISQHAMDMKDWGKVCPLKWLLFHQVIRKLNESNVPISTTTKLRKIAQHYDIGITDEEEFKLCLQYCHDNGTIIFFPEEQLKDHVILDPKWLIDAFRCLVSDRIENFIQVSDDWQLLIETGELTESLIIRLFSKEPQFNFLDSKAHLIQVMKRFDIIVNLKNSTALYMPCMMKICSFANVQKQLIDGIEFIYKTSWLCLEFDFLPPAFFNHILVWYIHQYHVSVILDKRTHNERKALYRQLGVFDLDSSGCEQLVVCGGLNIIALQVWNLRMSDQTYGHLGQKLFKFVKTLCRRYNLQISYTKTFKCKNGDFAINRKKIKDLVPNYYRCLEHITTHLSDDLVKPWNFIEELENSRRKENLITEEIPIKYAGNWFKLREKREHNNFIVREEEGC